MTNPTSQPRNPSANAPGSWPITAPTRIPTMRPIQDIVPSLLSLFPVAPHSLHFELQALRRRGRRGQGPARFQADLLEYVADEQERPRHGRAVAPAEEASPKPLQCERHHGRRRALDDALDAALEWVEIARVRDAPLREDRHQLARLQRLGDAIVRLLEELLVFLRRRDRDRLSCAEDERNDRRPEDVVVHHEADGPRARRAD